MSRSLSTQLSLEGEIRNVSVRVARPLIGFNQPQHNPRHFEGRALFIGDLAAEVTESDIWTLFQRVGRIHTVDIKRDKQTGVSRGYGFVVFRDSKDAATAHECLAHTCLKGRTIRLGWAQKNAKLFVALLPKEVTPLLLSKIMKPYGPLYEDETKISEHGFGFVSFQYRSDSEKARLMMDTSCLNFAMKDGRSVGMKVRVGWADDQTQRNCVHVHFDAARATEVRMTTMDLRQQFSAFGSVIKASTPKHPNNFLKGYGFVHFPETPEGEVCAANAILELNGKSIRGITWTCNFGKRKKEKQYPNKSRQHNPRPPERKIEMPPERAPPLMEQPQRQRVIRESPTTVTREHLVDSFAFLSHSPLPAPIFAPTFVNSSPLWQGQGNMMHISRSPSPILPLLSQPLLNRQPSPILFPLIQPMPVSSMPSIPSPILPLQRGSDHYPRSDHLGSRDIQNGLHSCLSGNI